jgi:NAD(P)H-dependent flavin oxidoreductase YrpB (nitropropane dioxygenase family)
MTPFDTAARDLLGCRYPLVLAGMGGVARAELVSAVSAAGGFGFLGMVRESAELIAREVGAVRAQGHERFGVNLIPAATAPDLLQAELDACIALSVPAVTLFWDIDAAVVARLREAGITVVYQVGSVEEGRAAAAAGAQVLIAQGVEAGGHVRGTTPLLDLLPALAGAVPVPVLAAGGIADGVDVAAALALGAQGAVLGTAMIATPESFAHDVHKERLLAAGDDDTVLTDAFHINWPDGAHVRVLDGPVTRGQRGDPRAAERHVIGWEAGRPIYLFSTDSPLKSMAGAFEEMPLYAGMGVGRVTKMVAAGVRLRRLVEETAEIFRLPGGIEDAESASPVCYAGLNPEYMGYLSHGALVGALDTLHGQAIGILRAARRGSPTQRHAARWALVLDRLIAGFGDGSARAPAAEARSEAGGLAALAATARALLPLVFEEQVRQALEALVSGDGGAPAAPAADAAPTPQGTLRASAR